MGLTWNSRCSDYSADKMTTYQKRDGNPCVGYLGDGPDDTDYQAMAQYLRQKWGKREYLVC